MKNYKTSVLVCLLLIYYSLLQANELNNTIVRHQYYEFGIECPMYKCDIRGKIIDSTLLIAPPQAKFLIVDFLNDYCIIRFTLLPQQHKVIKNNFYNTDDITTYIYFLITKAQIDFKAYPIVKSNIDLLVGNIFTPIKLRFNPFDFSKDISVGTTFGVKYQLKEKQNTAIDALFGLGISTLTIDSFSSRGKVSNADLLSFSPSIGFVLEFGNAQIGLFFGYDFISNANQKRYEWIYKNKPWLSFGIGYSLFSFNVKNN